MSSRRERDTTRSLHCRGYDVERVGEKELRAIFQTFGKVVDVYLPKDYHTKTLRGFAYIQFENEGDADTARLKLDRTDVFNDNHLVNIMWAAGERKTPTDMRRLDIERDNPHARRDRDRRGGWQDDHRRDRHRGRDFDRGRDYDRPPRDYDDPRDHDRGASREFSRARDNDLSFSAGRDYRNGDRDRDYDAVRRHPRDLDRDIDDSHGWRERERERHRDRERDREYDRPRDRDYDRHRDRDREFDKERNGDRDDRARHGFGGHARRSNPATPPRRENSRSRQGSEDGDREGPPGLARDGVRKRGREPSPRRRDDEYRRSRSRSRSRSPTRRRTDNFAYDASKMPDTNDPPTTDARLS